MIKVNLQKAKEIVHSVRRDAREKEFAPFDEIIMKQIPGKDHDAAESERASIREKYKTIQSEIENCKDESELKEKIKKITN